MERRPKTIEIFLPNGDPKGLKVAAVTKLSVEVTYVPRSEIAQARGRDGLDGVGLYVLVGEEEKRSKKIVYIGEAENTLKRLANHNVSKDFWEYAFLITSKTKRFTKTHVKYLEWLALFKAGKAGRYLIENNVTPKKPHISESMEADLEDYFETISLLLATLGLPIFQPLYEEEKRDKFIFHYKGRGAAAKGIYSEEGFVVLSGSQFIKELSPTMKKNSGHLKLRRQLIEEGTLKDCGEYYELMEDTLFSSPSNAGASVRGHPVNGWTAWQLPDGRTLSNIYRDGE